MKAWKDIRESPDAKISEQDVLGASNRLTEVKIRGWEMNEHASLWFEPSNVFARGSFIGANVREQTEMEQ